MNCVILQPSYIPWRGYFHQIQKADVFVFYDDVQYDRRGWRNRNRISTSAGPAWLTVPVHAHGSHRGLQTCDVSIAWDAKATWNTSHLEAIQRAYAHAPHYEELAPDLTAALELRDERLVELLIRLTMLVSEKLGITSTRFVRSSELDIAGERTERLVEITKAVGADHYISGPSAAAYIDEAKFHESGIGLEYMHYAYPDYPQLREPFEPKLSIIDLLMMTGTDAPAYIWDASHKVHAIGS